MPLSNEAVKMKYIVGELKGLRILLDYLCNGEQEAFNILYFIKSNYKEWDAMLIYMKRNNLRGKRLIEMFKNESPDGQGYHMGATHILSRLKGHKFSDAMIMVDELL